MKSKNILILGAGFLQKPAIESAKELGWNVTVVDGNQNAVCIPLADHFEHIDLKDIESLEKFSMNMKKRAGLDAVFTAGTDFSAAVAYLAEKNNLPGHTYAAARNATDKILMRTCFASHNVPSPLYKEISESEIPAMEAKIDKNVTSASEILGLNVDFPVVVKPADNMGARGCRMCRTADEVLNAIKDAVKYSRTSRAVIEEYMDGPEFSIDSLVYDGKIVITGFADRHIFFPPYFIEMGHTMSTSFSEAQMSLVADVFGRGVKALGLTCGAAKGDMKLTKKGAMIGEIAARLSGGYMSGWTFPYASGINLTKEALLLAGGQMSNLFSEENLKSYKKLAENVWYITPESYSAERAWISIPGKVAEIYGMADAEKTKGIMDVFPRAAVGDDVVFPVNNVEKCGNCISKASSHDEAVKASESAVSKITIRLEKGSKVTESFLEETGTGVHYAFKLSDEDLLKVQNMSESEYFTNTKSWESQIPEFMNKYLDVLDWNHKSLRGVLNNLYEILKEDDAEVFLPSKTFWKYGIRGSLQGFLFAADTYSGRK